MKLKKTIITIVLITVGSLLVQAATHKTQTVTGLSAMRVASGLTNKQVAERLMISRNTVNIHVNSIYKKLDIPSRGAATRYAIEHDLG